MPQPIKRKTGGEDKLPPVESLRSEFSKSLSNLRDIQQKQFSSLSSDGVLVYGAIKDNETYNALPHIIAELKKDMVKISHKMAYVIEESYALSDKLDQEQQGTNEQKIHYLRLAVMSLCNAGGQLISICSKIAENEQKLNDLEQNVMDDRCLPDFNALKDQSKNDEVDELSQKASSLMANEPAVDIFPVTPDNDVHKSQVPLTIDNEMDQPIKWKAEFKYSDTVVAPTEEGARAMVALRISKKVKSSDVAVRRN